MQGTFKTKDEVELQPGIRVEKRHATVYEPLSSEITSLHAGGKKVEEAQGGGLIGIGTLLDPSLTKADGLIGNLVGKPGTLPPTRTELTLEIHLFKRAVGTKEMKEIEKVHVGERILLDVGTTITVGNVISVGKNTATFKLTRPICAETGARSALNRRMTGRWRLIGYGIIK